MKYIQKRLCYDRKGYTFALFSLTKEALTIKINQVLWIVRKVISLSAPSTTCVINTVTCRNYMRTQKICLETFLFQNYSLTLRCEFH